MTADPLDILIAHNHWATLQLLDRVDKLSVEHFHRKFPIGLGSLHDTLVHIVGCIERWCDRIEQRSFRELPEGKRFTPHEIRDRLEAATNNVRALVANLRRDETLGDEFTTTFVLDEGERDLTFTRSAAITHLLVHGTHHRAQCLNMLRQLDLGEPLPELDVIDWQYETEKPS